jgi:hypothetical protein
MWWFAGALVVFGLVCAGLGWWGFLTLTVLCLIGVLEYLDSRGVCSCGRLLSCKHHC